MEPSSIDIQLIDRARNGEAQSLEEIVRHVQGRVYALCLRMLYDPDDAEDACQEILVKLVTRLGSFRGEAAFETWAHALAANHLRDLLRRKGPPVMSMEEATRRIEAGYENDEAWDENVSEQMQALLALDMRLHCVQAMLLCLDTEYRLAYVLGEIFGLDHDMASRIMAVSPAGYRQRLSRARKRLHTFLSGKCSLVDPDKPCTCRRQAAFHSLQGTAGTTFAKHPRLRRDSRELNRALREVDAMRRAGELMRADPEIDPPDMAERIGKALRSNGLRLLT